MGIFIRAVSTQHLSQYSPVAGLPNELDGAEGAAETGLPNGLGPLALEGV